MLPAILLALLLHFASSEKNPIVDTPFGRIEGITKSFNNFSFEVFHAIPYAATPVGDKRFKRPEIISMWNDTLKAFENGPACHGFFVRETGGNKTVDENCLFVDIVRPSNVVIVLTIGTVLYWNIRRLVISTRNEEKFPMFGPIIAQYHPSDTKSDLPILVFIHGGGFIGGDGKVDDNTVAQNFVSRGIIFVTIQYRLGSLGFFSTGDDVLPGNMGMWDQTMALKFINEIIPSFGGDRERITISGQSAGAASVSLLLYSPHSYDYFAQSIQISGSAFTKFAITDKVVNASQELSAALNCTSSKSAEILKCMQSADIKDVIRLSWSQEEDPPVHLAVWSPRIDGDFLPANTITELANSAPIKTTIQGVNTVESEAILVSMVFESQNGTDQNFTRSRMIEKMEIGLEMMGIGMPSDEFRKEIINRYAPPNESEKSYIRQLQNFLDDFSFFVPNSQELAVKALNGWPTYFYVNDYDSQSLNGMEEEYPIKGAMHSMELGVLFYNRSLSETDEQFQEVMLDAFVNFVKNGTPSTKKHQWSPITVDHPFHNFRMNPHPEEADDFGIDAYNFWSFDAPYRIGEDLMRTAVFPGTPRIADRVLVSSSPIFNTNFLIVLLLLLGLLL